MFINRLFCKTNFLSLAIAGAIFLTGAQTALAASPDLGDAPDSSNHDAVNMIAYPGVIAQYPTVFDPFLPGPSGPRHNNNVLSFYLGDGISREFEADMLADADGPNNIRPLADAADMDRFDDGILKHERFEHCTVATVVVRVNIVNPGVVPFFNMWFDWRNDGSWAPNPLPVCANGLTPADWAISNVPLALPPGVHDLEVPIPVYNRDKNQDIWVRVSLSDMPANPDGSGPAVPYNFGETEDYLLPSFP